MDTGWIKLYRKTLDDEIFQNEKLLKVFIWCLLKATHKSHTQMVGLTEILLEEGQFVTGRKKASLELNMSESTSWRCILKLKELGLIKLYSNSKFSLVTIDKYGFYQSKNGMLDNKRIESKDTQPFGQLIGNEAEPKADNKWTGENVANTSIDKGLFCEVEQQMDSKWTASGQPVDTNKNVKNDKNEKNKESKKEDVVSKISLHYEKCFRKMVVPIHIEKLISFVEDGMEIELVMYIMEYASTKKDPYVYALKVLNNSLSNKITTIHDFKISNKEKSKPIDAGEIKKPKIAF